MPKHPRLGGNGKRQCPRCKLRHFPDEECGPLCWNCGWWHHGGCKKHCWNCGAEDHKLWDCTRRITQLPAKQVVENYGLELNTFYRYDHTTGLWEVSGRDRMRDFLETNDKTLPTGEKRRHSPSVDEETNGETVLVARRQTIDDNPEGKPANPSSPREDTGQLSIKGAAGFSIKGAATRQQVPRRYAPYPSGRPNAPGGQPSGRRYMPPQPKPPRRSGETHHAYAAAVRQDDRERMTAQGPPRERRQEAPYTLDQEDRYRR
ncbi:hypothetical protein PV05_04162 [Exophiala xenobiotica]|uniref:CCHC-type domain-containing protein n=1 Tax=Exophiala xenobiotica TaxID=348802 RepID=A0A0D2EVJ8_9EURO|nr:uncharacterized protein PV05_04162 [Exophiala xenobiotica]KIW59728.1 hypothetical protein PV05_04162 [Exophiala xenobiotica]